MTRVGLTVAAIGEIVFGLLAGRVANSRAAGSLIFPAAFMLVAAR